MNLTSITEDYDVIMKHFIDSLEVVKYINDDSNVIDVGTGAGFPGIVIAIYFEGKVNITLLDALNKRLIFLEEVIKNLNLKNIEIIHGRAEEMAHNENYRNKYDIVVSRAVAPLNILVEYNFAYLKLGGKCLLLKGSNVQEEIKSAKKAIETLKLKITNIFEYKYVYNEEEYKRYIIEIKRIKEVSNKYPRSNGKIKMFRYYNR